jgi:hypothetical protein
VCAKKDVHKTKETVEEEEDKLNTNIIINFYYNQITFSLFNIKLASLQRIYS